MPLLSLLRKIPGFLSRETSGGKFIPQVDGLRFIAVMAVLIYHINGYLLVKAGSRLSPVLPLSVPVYVGDEIQTAGGVGAATDFLGRIFSEGYFGVQLFFAISGLIIATPFAASRLAIDPSRAPAVPTMKKYLLRRVTRLEPPYIINLMVCFVITALFASHLKGNTLTHLLASMFYIHYPVFGTGSTINPVAWSLEIEIQFYLLAPLFAAVFLIRQPLVRRGVIAAAIVAAGLMVSRVEPPFDHAPTQGWTILSQIHWFLVGFLLADLSATDWKAPSRGTARTAWDVAGAAAWVALWLVLAHRAYTHMLAPWLVFIAYGAGLRGRFWSWFFSRWAIYTIGGMCYTIYLYHMLVIASFGRFTVSHTLTQYFAVNLVIQTLALGSVVLCVSSVMFALFERPFMSRDWPARFAAWAGLRKEGAGAAKVVPADAVYEIKPVDQPATTISTHGSPLP